MKKVYLSIIFLAGLISTGCSANIDHPTISKNTESAYEETFNDLALGMLFDFNFHLPEADKRWVTLWVESYSNGERDPQPLTQLSYGNNPVEVEKGNMGFGIINPDGEDSMVFLYGPDVKSAPEKVERDLNQGLLATWDYAIGEEEVELELGETKILAAYRKSAGNSMRTIDYQDEESVTSIIEEGETVLLLKIKVEEKESEFYYN
ncbi:hypothetical protein [Rossellomorea aquimaris]|uniref:Lipoprotein n=1 Tax=Rossellomorea aquimaris TaxID=189382 RepID=A0A5D4TWX8_9BACI|nr:hypothetical protein [Rossellomorea aquimaris]TYS79681.1 hypothetical protein FZC80_08515 [Rossellomorea aquimaris]